MNRRAFLGGAGALAARAKLANALPSGPETGARSAYQLAAYYFGNYHVDSRNEAAHGSGWTEWRLVQAATPRFVGHNQPKTPLWGFEDESNPKVFAKKIDAAANARLDAFIFDWYWYDDGPFLQGALEGGYLRAQN